MRQGLLDIGSQSATLWVVGGGRGSPPVPVHRAKAPTGLAETTGPDGVVDPVGVKQLVAAVCEVLDVARTHGVADLVAYGTSAVRDAANRDTLVEALRAGAGIDVSFLTGEEEGRLTYLAAHRWYGWSSGGLLLLDIGGGSLEIVRGCDEEPEVALSLPVGAARMTRTHLRTRPSGRRELKLLRRHVRTVLGSAAGRVAAGDRSPRRVATSRTFTQLSGFAGEPGQGAATGTRILRRQELLRWIPKLAAMTPAQRARLPGVSRRRARQILAGAVIAETTMAALGIGEVEICPWALREGVLLHLNGCAPGSALLRPVRLAGLRR